MNYAIEQRLRFIDFLLSQYGHINRAALVEYFGISVPQASNDIKEYQKLNPKAIKYNGKSKRYETFKFSRAYQ